MNDSSHTLSGWVLGPQGWRRGRLSFGARITGFEPQGTQPADPLRDPQPGPGELLVLPGFIDLHLHGGGGADVMDGGDATQRVAHLHARHGTTSMLATTMTAPAPDIDRALAGVARAMQARHDGAVHADVLGVHLEGPFINPQRLGAQPDHCVPGDLATVERWHGIAPIRVVTLATEHADNLALVRALSARGMRVQMGHTGATYEQACDALAHGLAGFTHLFNAMGSFHQRAPGVVGAALAHAEYAELITDLVAVHPGALRAGLRAIPRVYAVTDATAAAGMPDGEYALGRQRVHKCLGEVRLADGTIAGSALTMDQALRNLVQLPMTLADASNRLSRYPADYLGVAHKGRIEPGADADLVVLDAALLLREVHVRGRRVGDEG